MPTDRLDHPPPRRLARPSARRRRCSRRSPAYTARQFARAIVMPNLAPPVTERRRGGGLSARASWPRCRTGSDFTPLMTCYLTDHADRGRDRARLRDGRVRRRPSSIPPTRRPTPRTASPTSRTLASGAGGDAADRHAAARPWRGHRSRGRHLRPRGGVHRARAAPACVARFPGAQDRASSISPPPRRSPSSRAPARTSPRRSRRST